VRHQLKLEVYYAHPNKRVRPLRGRPLWDHPCSWVRACCFGAF